MFRDIPLCTITAEPELLYNLRERITGVLLEEIGAGVPARPATHAFHTIYGYIHATSPFLQFKHL
jgi:hypothetical protein